MAAEKPCAPSGSAENKERLEGKHDGSYVNFCCSQPCCHTEIRGIEQQKQCLEGEVHNVKGGQKIKLRALIKDIAKELEEEQDMHAGYEMGRVRYYEHLEAE